MKRRDFMTLAASATVAWPFGAGGQEAGRNYRLGILWPFPYGTPESSLLAEGLRPYGFIDGKNLNIDYRCWTQHVGQVWDDAAEFVGEHVDAVRHHAEDESALLIFNSFENEVDFKLPQSAIGPRWSLALDTNDPEKAGDSFDFGSTCNVAGRSFVLFISTSNSS